MVVWEAPLCLGRAGRGPFPAPPFWMMLPRISGLLCVPACSRSRDRPGKGWILQASSSGVERRGLTPQRWTGLGGTGVKRRRALRIEFQFPRCKSRTISAQFLPQEEPALFSLQGGLDGHQPSVYSFCICHAPQPEGVHTHVGACEALGCSPDGCRFSVSLSLYPLNERTNLG